MHMILIAIPDKILITNNSQDCPTYSLVRILTSPLNTWYLYFVPHHYIQQHHLIQSMSRKGNCLDNEFSESFFHTLRTKLKYHHQYQAREDLIQTIFEYIEVF